MSKDKRLGRGLEALLGRVPPTPQEGAAGAVPRPHVPMPGREQEEYGESVEQLYEMPTPEFAGQMPSRPSVRQPMHSTGVPIPDEAPSGTGQLRISIDQIDRNPFQPREHFDEEELAALAESLKSHGLLQPVVVRRVEGRYELVAGERRLRAARRAGWTDVPAQVVEADDRQVAELAIVENLQRKDLNPLEKAASFRRYLNEYQSTQEELASRLQIDRSTVANLIRLLDLPDEVQTALRENRITQGHARALLALPNAEELIEACRYVEAQGLSVRKTEALVQAWLRGEKPGQKAQANGPANRSNSDATSEHLAALEQEFRRALGTKVRITHNGNGRGKLVIPFRSHEEFEQIRNYICGSELIDGE